MLGTGANANPKKPVIRRETVLVPVKKPGVNGLHKPQSSSAKPPVNRYKLSNRASPKPAIAQKKIAKKQGPAQKVVAESRGIKRKSTTPERVVFSDDEDGDSSDGTSDSNVSRKRIKSSVSSVESLGPRRDLVLPSAFGDEPQLVTILHGADATSGENAAKFNNAFYAEDFATVELQYPSNSPRERFELKWPKNESDDYKPMTDIIETIKMITSFYFPDDLREKYMSDETGWGRQFNRAWNHSNIPEFTAVVDEFNAVLKGLVDDGTIKHELAKKRHVPLDIVSRITEQIYSRTVSPKVETLRAYQNGSDNVYGELRERFCSQIFQQTKMNHEMVFVDLGSGVGNVVLQAALEVGCESWGIEMMKNPCDLADLQAKEFPGRARLWGINCGNVNLIRGDFTDNTEISAVLRRADIVLVNNQAFTPALNDKLRDMFLDLKNGCQVVSLKPFVPEGHKISMRNISDVGNLFVQKKYDYFSKCVSWTDQHGHYYIATKDPRPLEAYHQQARGR
jgi:H3 lysine-79-specific histone-lysine N-methyltransferase